MKAMLLPSTTTTATNWETWFNTMEVLLRSSFPILSDRLRKLSKKRINGADNSYYDDDMYSPVTKTAREEEKLTELLTHPTRAQLTSPPHALSWLLENTYRHHSKHYQRH